ncbi:MAG: hypothetical protein IPK19_04975 [Chloroflexi bacterium]|nr:hypothetical protein [Chloroflexota bacterium]
MAQNVRDNQAVSGRGYSVQPERDTVNVYERTTLLPTRLKRISWSAVAGGIVLALVAQIALQLLGLSIGVNTINPATDATPVDPNLGPAAVIWIAASILISLFVGGWVAGYLSGIPDRTDGALHGLLVWAVVMLLSLWLLTSSAVSLVNGVSSALGSAISAAGQGIAAIAGGEVEVDRSVSTTVQNIGPGVADALGLETSAIEQVGEDVRDVIGASADPETSEAATAEAEDAAEQIAGAVQDLLRGETIDEAQRQEVVTLIAERTGVSQEEAAQTLSRWETSIQDARVQVEQTLEEAGQRLADMVSTAAGILFLAMVIGAFAAGAGGLVGSPDEEDMIEAAPTTTTTTTSTMS